MLTYLRCARANVFTWAGLLVFIVAIAIGWQLPEGSWEYLLAWLIGYIGFASFTLTKGGYETYRTYTRTSRILRAGHDPVLNMQPELMFPCDKIGYNMAMKDWRLERETALE